MFDRYPFLAQRALRRVVLVGMIAAAAPSQALTSRADLEKWCTQGSSVAASGRCLGYLLAAEDAMSHDSIEGIRACLPRDITLQEQHLIVVNWLRDNPGVETKTAMGMVARAYAARHPCPR